MTPAAVTPTKAGVLDLLADIGVQARRVQDQQNERAAASRKDLDTLTALRAERIEAEAAATRTGVTFDPSAIDATVADLEAAIAERDSSAAHRRALEQLATERKAIIEGHRPELVALALERRDETDQALDTVIASVADLEHTLARLRTAAGLALTGLDTGAGGTVDPLARHLFGAVRPWLTGRRAIRLDAVGLRTTTDMYAEIRGVVAIAAREVSERAPGAGEDR